MGSDKIRHELLYVGVRRRQKRTNERAYRSHRQMKIISASVSCSRAFPQESNENAVREQHVENDGSRFTHMLGTEYASNSLTRVDVKLITATRNTHSRTFFSFLSCGVKKRTNFGWAIIRRSQERSNDNEAVQDRLKNRRMMLWHKETDINCRRTWTMEKKMEWFPSLHISWQFRTPCLLSPVRLALGEVKSMQRQLLPLDTLHKPLVVLNLWSCHVQQFYGWLKLGFPIFTGGQAERLKSTLEICVSIVQASGSGVRLTSTTHHARPDRFKL